MYSHLTMYIVNCIDFITKQHGYKEEDKIRLESFRTECKEAVESAKLSYLSNLGYKLNEPGKTSKKYWKFIHRVMKKCRAPQIPPILKEGTFLNCIDTANLFNEHFSNQCKLIVNNSSLPVFEHITDKRIDLVSIKDEEIVFLIRKLNPNKAAGPDGSSGQMLLICDSSAVLPLKLIFQNILETSIYPNVWKLASVTTIFKKADKQLLKNYRPNSLLTICVKSFEKMIFASLYSYLNNNCLVTHNQYGFRPGDSTTNQLLFHLNEIHEAFENPNSLEV